MEKSAVISTWLVAALAVIIASGCATSHRNATRDELVSLKRGYGVVVGSFDIVVDYNAAEDFGARSWVRADSRRTVYEVDITRRGPRGETLAAHAQRVRTTAWEPAAFVKKVPAGEYRVRGVDVYTGTLDDLGRKVMRAPVDFRFTVEPGVMTYVGRMTMSVPPRLYEGRTRVRHTVHDAEAFDFAALGWELGEAPLVYIKRMADPRRHGYSYGTLGRR